jgi:FkbM family methyltransferase
MLQYPATITLAEGHRPLNMKLPPVWHGQAKLCYAFRWRNDDDLAFLIGHLPEGAAVIDVGANIGTWTLLMAHKTGRNGTVVASEPTADTFRTLVANIRMNDMSNVRLHRVALSDWVGTSRLYHDMDGTRNSLGHTRSAVTDFEEVATLTLDQLVKQERLTRVDFIKIDVEGAEPLVLAGAREAISSYRPVILFEINESAMRALNFAADSAWAILRNHQYRFYQLTEGSILIRVLECPRSGNVWAFPEKTDPWA